jgi:uncharacterized phage protein (TIGR02216 family)
MNPRWQAWLQLAVLRFGLSPPAFWALTLTEWRALLAALAPGGGAALDRAGLERLRAAYPDERSEP